ncbi:acetyl-CoA carboxylase biotin carboxylase subunit [Lacibacterium aquatile]|uniref:Acetyl-CoA carboxylase biotin carboxylase subunit n=1 Tax=Lacibacterium aquatile TaxID=1168082 RepID=A0ABW5DSP6_9PROT
MNRRIATLLIANRGEIACRVIRTARQLGIRTVAVYSDADAKAAHVAMADVAVRLGPAPARESYLKGDAIIQAAKDTGADAIHPGYGFLSENADFADACAKAGIIFVGPPASAIRAMGSKSAAKSLMEKATVPLVPGYHGEDQDAALLQKEADRIGYPVLIKASAGGGGKGMKVVQSAADFPEQLASAQREAQASFGDAKVLVEKYLTRPRHIEVQVFADTQGECVYLFERDCSIQRRHQKVVEEAPAPGMTLERRAAMGKAACDAARAVGYVGAGTVEFIAEGDGFYFMEMNTRLQVEHPVTEAITGQDLVEWQIRVAEGASLPLTQEQLTLTGHAIEVRLYAEDPQKEFLPQTGRLAHLRLPEGLPGVRVDSGVRTGDSVSIHYDPMIAKVIAEGATRDEAIRRLSAALGATEVVGLNTNRTFLKAIIDHPAFADADLDTGFIERYRADLLPAPQAADDLMLGLAALALLEQARAEASDHFAGTSDPHSPWAQTTGWRLNRDAFNDLHLMDGEHPLTVRAHFVGGDMSLDLPRGRTPVFGTLQADGRLAAQIGDRSVTAHAFREGASLTVQADGRQHRFTVIDPRDNSGVETGGGGKLTAPMPGKVVAVKVEAGQSVKKGQPLMVVEAMKMEHTIAAPRDGVVQTIRFSAGDLVDDGAELLTLEALEG